MRPEGTIVTVNPAFDNGASRWLARTIAGTRLEALLVQPGGVDLETVGDWISSGQVRPVVDRSYPLSDAVAAHRYSESKRTRGKLILVVDERLAAASAKSIP